MKVSVVITAYNVSSYIEKCITSVLNQNIGKHELEIIVVEDCSTDNTYEILENIAKKYPKVILTSNLSNCGAGLSRRYGIKSATGDYILLLDGDDYLFNNNYIKALADAAEKSNADVVSGGIKIEKEDGSYDITSYGNCVCEGFCKITKFWGERIVFMNNKIIRKTMYDKFPYCHRRYIEDTPVIIPILWAANKVKYIDVVGYSYTMRRDSLTHTADTLKNIIFKGLCWCDLMEFFNANDPKVFEYLNIKQYIANVINLFNNNNITFEVVEPYKNEFFELMLRLVNLINVKEIDFKIPKILNNYGKQ